MTALFSDEPVVEEKPSATEVNRNATAAVARVTRTTRGRNRNRGNADTRREREDRQEKTENDQKTAQSLNAKKSLKRSNSRPQISMKSRIPAPRNAADASLGAKTDDDVAKVMTSRSPPASARANRLTRHLWRSTPRNVSPLQRRWPIASASRSVIAASSAHKKQNRLEPQRATRRLLWRRHRLNPVHRLKDQPGAPAERVTTHATATK